MRTQINAITKQLFQKETLDGTSTEELQSFIERYPYSASARFLLAKKMQHDQEMLITAGLYLNNPLRLDWLLKTASDIDEPEVKDLSPATPSSAVGATVIEKTAAADEIRTLEEPLAFQSYHTIDYFASQGIRLQLADLGKDKLGQQLKSFTEWLRSMKKLPSSETAAPQVEDSTVTRTAATSIEEKEVVTEAMAEVWMKQGNKEKARAILMKLSLLNPDKSAYFAAKIDQLK